MAMLSIKGKECLWLALISARVIYFCYKRSLKLSWFCTIILPSLLLLVYFSFWYLRFHFCLGVSVPKFSSMNFKDVILSAGNNQGGTSSSFGAANVPTCVIGLETPTKNATADVLANCLLDPPGDAAFPESVVVDYLSQIQKDIEELSKSFLVGKMLGEPLDVRTIVSRTKAEWKFVKSDIEFLELENHWILLRFCKP